MLVHLRVSDTCLTDFTVLGRGSITLCLLKHHVRQNAMSIRRLKINCLCVVEVELENRGCQYFIISRTALKRATMT